MAKVYGPLHADGASGEMADSMAFRTYRGVKVVRKSGIKYNRNSTAQQDARALLRQAVAGWQALPWYYKEFWSDASSSARLPAYQLYLKQAINALKAGGSLPLFPDPLPPTFLYSDRFNYADGPVIDWTSVSGSWDVFSQHIRPTAWVGPLAFAVAMPDFFAGGGNSHSALEVGCLKHMTGAEMQVNFLAATNSEWNYYIHFYTSFGSVSLVRTNFAVNQQKGFVNYKNGPNADEYFFLGVTKFPHTVYVRHKDKIVHSFLETDYGSEETFAPGLISRVAANGTFDDFLARRP